MRFLLFSGKFKQSLICGGNGEREAALFWNIQAGFDLWVQWGERLPRFRYVQGLDKHSGSVGLSPFQETNLLFF